MKAQCLDVASIGKDDVRYVKQGEWIAHERFPNAMIGLVIVIPRGYDVMEINQYAPQPIGEGDQLHTTVGIFIKKKAKAR